MAISVATVLQVTMVVLALLSKPAAAACPAGTTAVPADDIGFPDSTTGTTTPPPVAYCCPGNSVVQTWTLRTSVSVTKFTFLGSITAKCSDGTALPTIEVTPGVGAVEKLGPRKTTKAQYWNTFVARGANWVDKFLNVGGGGGRRVRFSCPAGQYAVGFKASPDYWGLNLLQVICGPSSKGH